MAKADFREVPKGALPDAKEHFGSPSDVAKTIQSLRTEISVLREALLRTYATNEGLKDGCRAMREAIIKYAGEKGLKELIHAIPAIPEDDLFVDGVVQRASVIDSGLSCRESCLEHFCVGSSCPLYAVVDE